MIFTQISLYYYKYTSRDQILEENRPHLSQDVPGKLHLHQDDCPGHHQGLQLGGGAARGSRLCYGGYQGKGPVSAPTSPPALTYAPPPAHAL